MTRNGADIEIRASALSFLHHQVRSSSVRWSMSVRANGRPATSKAALDAADCAPAAGGRPSSGLFLMQVDY